MKVNTKVRYGLRAILQIAEGYGADPVPISAIAASQEISSKYLEQVVGTLRKSGLITSRKGVRGGYSLARAPEDIDLWQIITSLDAHTALVDCVDDPASCERADDCLTRTIWSLLSIKMREFWSSFTLADLGAIVKQTGGNPAELMARLDNSVS
jgi:Rrf2 family cysteine metabolism transcriptional repressor